MVFGTNSPVPAKKQERNKIRNYANCHVCQEVLQLLIAVDQSIESKESFRSEIILKTNNQQNIILCVAT